VDPTARAVVLADGEAIHYDKVLIATGGRNRKPPIPGLDLNGIYALRTVEDCDRIKEMAQPGRKAVVVGMGFIGSEVAASLRTHGLEVTALDGGKAPLARVLGEEIGNVLAQLHRDNGVDVRLEQAVAGFEGEGNFKGVRTGAGDLIEGDFCVVGLGIEPVTDLVAGSDINVDNGIVVDAYCRTNVEDVYAAGDVANHYHPVFGRQMRVEHYNNALKHGAAAALSMLGRGAPYSEIHSFWSDQYDVTLEYAGHHMSWDELVIRGDLASRDFIAFYLKDGLIEAAAGMNRALDVRAAVPLIRARKPVDVAKLRDPAVSLTDLA
jgi:3-phenylpropionate/trans-cinnamate dioxygenase ferredoxin reductase subunit